MATRILKAMNFGVPGNPLASASIYVHNTVTFASLYSDSGGVSAIANPTTLDVNGNLHVYIADGSYDVQVTSGTNTITINDVQHVYSLPLTSTNVGGNSTSIYLASGAPSATTLPSGNFVIGDLYFDTNLRVLYVCTTAGTQATSVWISIVGVAALSQFVGSKSANYTTTSTTAAVVDATNLETTQNVAGGFASKVTTSGTASISAGTLTIILNDSVNGILNQQQITSTTATSFFLEGKIAGDNLSHTVSLQWHVDVNTNTGTIINSSTVFPILFTELLGPGGGTSSFTNSVLTGPLVTGITSTSPFLTISTPPSSGTGAQTASLTTTSVVTTGKLPVQYQGTAAPSSVTLPTGTYNIGDEYYDTQNFNVYRCFTSGSNSSSVWGAITEPTGSVKAFSGPSTGIPLGYLICDNSAISRTTYRNLFNIIGTTFGSGDGSTTFNLPDMRGYVPLGATPGGQTPAPGITARNPGTVVGEETHTLSIFELASHTHGVSDPGHTHGVSDSGHVHSINDSGHTHSLNSANGMFGQAGDAQTNAGSGSYTISQGANWTTVVSATTGVTVANHTTGISNSNNTTGITANNTGNGNAHNNLQPSTVMFYIIKL